MARTKGGKKQAKAAGGKGGRSRPSLKRGRKKKK